MFTFPPGIGLKDVKGHGTSGMVALIPDTQKILKFPVIDEEGERERCDKEKAIYQLLQSSSHRRLESLLRFYGSTSHGILLEYADLGPIRLYLRSLESPLPTSILLRWALEAAEALHFVHLNGVAHGDINCTNLFIHNRLELKLGDFTSSFTYATIPRPGLEADIRDFGSALFEMETGQLPHPDLSVFEREDALDAKQYPDLARVTTLKSVVLHYWNRQYGCMENVVEDIKFTGLVYLLPLRHKSRC
jgi:serine/threonine protein kinase